MPHYFKPRVERGLSLLEVGLVVVLSVLVVVAISMSLSNSMRQSKLRDTAQQMSDWASAATAYMEANRNRWIDQANLAHPGTPADGTLFQPADTSAADLVDGHYASSLLTRTLSTGQQLKLRVQLHYSAALQDKWQLEALLFSQGPSLADDELGSLITLLGARGGAVTNSRRTQIQGLKGGWRSTVAAWGGAPQPGQVALLLGAGMDGLGVGAGHAKPDTGSWMARKYLPGRIDLNTMQTDLGMSADAQLDQSCEPPVRLNGQKTGRQQLLVCQKTSTGWKWQSIRDLGEFNAFDRTSISGGTQYNETALRDMFVVATATDSHEANDGCSVFINVQPSGATAMTRVDQSQIKHSSNSYPTLADRCTVSAYIHQGWSYQVRMSMDGWSKGSGDGYLVRYFHE